MPKRKKPAGQLSKVTLILLVLLFCSSFVTYFVFQVNYTNTKQQIENTAAQAYAAQPPDPSCAVAPGGGRYAFTGVVRDRSTKQVLPNTLIEIRHPGVKGRKGVYTTTKTDAEGKYYVEIHASIYDLVASSGRYIAQTAHWDWLTSCVDRCNIYTQNFDLSPKGYADGSKRVFAAYLDNYSGANLGGLVGADQECQKQAGLSGLGGTWKAWLSDGSTSAASRFNRYSGLYTTLDGSVIADNWDDLTDGSLRGMILTNIKQYGGNNYVNFCKSMTNRVLTNTNPDGSRADGSSHCNNWTNNLQSSSVVIGMPNQSDGSWTKMDSLGNCSGNLFSNDYYVYCVEQ